MLRKSFGSVRRVPGNRHPCRAIDRRAFIGQVFAGMLAAPLVALAQQRERMRRIGVLMGFPESDVEAQRFLAAFRDGLHKLRWTEGSNIRIDTRWATPGAAHVMQQFAKELVALQPDLILSHTTPTTTALLQQTHTIPIVFATVTDPVGSGFVASLARPGGNVTGFTVMEPKFIGKWPELTKSHPSGAASAGHQYAHGKWLHGLVVRSKVVWICASEVVNLTVNNPQTGTPCLAALTNSLARSR
jgi:ABC-type uncharacterized transport system substrate-binding protein